MPARIRTVLFGAGAIGAGIGRLAAARDDIELVGAIDSGPERAGRPLGEVLNLEALGDVAISADAGQALRDLQPQAVLHATGSYLPDVLPQLLTCARAGANVVSTCEELSYPWYRHPELAKQIDAEAKASGVTVLGTGINPGFVMDTLPVTLSGACQRVERVRMARIVDVSTRRVQLQRKVGVGLTVAEFEERVAGGRFGHVGLKESCWMLADGLGWRLTALHETIEPVAGEDGVCAGIRQVATGTVAGRTVIEALVQMSTTADDPRDEIEIDGTPHVRLRIDGGIPGDTATASVVVNALPAVVAHHPGLVTMLDLPPVRSRGA
jgi:4-hydroxy-tetrahydrodipicolinate reductase